MKTNKEYWLPKEGFGEEGTKAIGFIATEKGFQVITERIVYINGEWRWRWGGAIEKLKHTDQLLGVMPWPEPPVEDSKKDE